MLTSVLTLSLLISFDIDCLLNVCFGEFNIGLGVALVAWEQVAVTQLAHLDQKSPVGNA